MVFKGLPHKVNELLGNLTYTPLISDGADVLRIQVTDMDSAGGGGISGSTSVAAHAGSLDISVLEEAGGGSSRGAGGGAALCVRAVGLCVPETVAYGAMFSLAILLLLSPLLYPVARSGFRLCRYLKRRVTRAVRLNQRQKRRGGGISSVMGDDALFSLGQARHLKGNGDRQSVTV